MRGSVKFEKKLFKSGGSVCIGLPKELLVFLGVENKNLVYIGGFIGKHGKYLAIWSEKEDDTLGKDNS